MHSVSLCLCSPCSLSCLLAASSVCYYYCVSVGLYGLSCAARYCFVLTFWPPSFSVLSYSVSLPFVGPWNLSAYFFDIKVSTITTTNTTAPATKPEQNLAACGALCWRCLERANRINKAKSEEVAPLPLRWRHFVHTPVTPRTGKRFSLSDTGRVPRFRINPMKSEEHLAVKIFRI